MDVGLVFLVGGGVLLSLSLIFFLLRSTEKPSSHGNGKQRKQDISLVDSTGTNGESGSVKNDKGNGKKKKKKNKSDKEKAAMKSNDAPSNKSAGNTTAPVSQEAAPSMVAPSTAAVAVTEPITLSAVASSSDGKRKGKESPEERGKRLDRQRQKKVEREQQEAAERDAALAAAAIADEEDRKAAMVATSMHNMKISSSNDEDGDWTEVKPSKNKQKKMEAEAKAIELALKSQLKINRTEASSATVAPAAVENVEIEEIPMATDEMSVDSKKVGTIIGPKGATLNKIRKMTNVTINIPKTEKSDDTKDIIISLTGPLEEIPRAKHAINDLCQKGYSKFLEGEDFMESNFSITNRTKAQLFQGGAKAYKILQNKYNIKINFPEPPANKQPKLLANGKPDPNATTKITIGGFKENVLSAKLNIKEIGLYHHCDITHPGIIHNEMNNVPHQYYNVIIGSKGSQIKHIRNNFKVDVQFPQPGTSTEDMGVLVIGEPAKVEAASKFIDKLVSQAQTESNAVTEDIKRWAAAESTEAEDANPEWMNQFMVRETKPLVSETAATASIQVLPPDFASSSAQPTPQEAMAWGAASDADGWN
jgi:rRNA processing protein Krr1/Pno1